MRVTDKYVFFWGEIFSNWQSCIFDAEYGGETYRFFNTEQYFMFVKAKTFGDEEIAKRILKEGENPKIAKALGRKVKNYDDAFWNGIRYQVMVDANLYKYNASMVCREELLNPKYKGKHFVEASPVDCIWGVGLAEDNPLIDDEKNWRGTNLLGKALDAVREILLEKEKN
jgi:ribA/ribD-fused uncharacterized protein